MLRVERLGFLERRILIGIRNRQPELLSAMVPVEHMSLPGRIAPLDQRPAVTARLEGKRL